MQHVVAVFLLAVCVVSSGCANSDVDLKRVKPWQRGNLAKEVMIKGSSAHHSALEQHAYSSKEASQGGYGVGGGGCGCN